MTRFALGCAAALLLTACDSGDGGSGTTLGGTSAASGTTSGSSSTGDGSSTAGESSSGDGSSSGGSSSGGSSSGSSSSGDPNACDPQVPGDWNACVDANGNVDNTLCNWMGLSGPSGFIGCLNSSETGGANVCMISGCEDVCDCFAAPATGTATVACSDVLQGGGSACVLDCSNGETCPDGMSCEGGLCFHPPA